VPEPPLTDQRPIAHLTISAEAEYLHAVLGLVREVAAGQGLDGPAVERLAVVVEEACANVIENAYAPGEAGPLEVSVLRRPGKLVVVVEDKGVPFDFQAVGQGGRSGLAGMLAKAYDGEVHCTCQGREGNRVELVARLPATAVPSEVAREEIARSASSPPAAAGEPLATRLMQPDEAMALVRCLYRTYGYSYDCDYMYDPAKVRELQEGGLMCSGVAVNLRGQIVAHIALHFERPGAKVAEAAQAFVDPRYRGHGLFERVKAFLKDHALSAGLYGIYSEAVTVHPYSQKGNLHLGANETGFLLGYIPATVSYNQIKERQQQRQSVALFYLKVNEGPARAAHPPPHHEAMVRQIYQYNGLARELPPEAAGPAGPLPPSAQLDVKVRADHNEAFLRVRSFGQDLDGLVRYRLRELCLGRVDCIYLDLPLSDPHTARLAPRLEDLGFFFGGIIPEVADGDALRLQCLNNVAVEPGQIQVGSDHGKELLAYVLRAREAAPEVLFH
jgi:serine/threonine-protein kinase RsbW